MITYSEIKLYQSNLFDTQFAAACKAGQITWYPWVGKKYPNAACKVLVVLESHYINWERTNIEALEKPDFTRRVVAEQSLPQHHWNSNTFNNLSSCLSGQRLTPEQAHLLWEQAALYNFVQRPMDNPDARPTEQDWTEGWKAFGVTVDILRPDVCIFAGFGAISNTKALPAGIQITGLTPWEQEEINGTYPRPCFTIQTPNYTVKGSAVKHPGSFFSTDKWRAVLQRQLPQAVKTLSM
ncbi:MAG: hypothetical protein ACI37O_01850 [Candidatus Avelusimicrobium sp.]|uniref:hypothetical protein n=1 Tax=Candidatus Avelusimicrobium sp. TaxID=3048833 RepID=UPI003F0256E8